MGSNTPLSARTAPKDFVTAESWRRVFKTLIRSGREETSCCESAEPVQIEAKKWVRHPSQDFAETRSESKANAVRKYGVIASQFFGVSH